MTRALALAPMLIAASAFAQAPPPPPQPHTITVSGSATVQVVPDRVSFTVGVSTENASVAVAFRENNEKTRRVIDALKAHGVTPDEIQTTDLTIGEAYENSQRVHGRYDVSNIVTVTRNDPKSASDLIQAAVDAGANSLNRVRFLVGNSAAANDRALAEAYADARRQAEKLASAAGKTIGDTVVINATGPSDGGWMMVTKSAAPIESGSDTVAAFVTVTFELR